MIAPEWTPTPENILHSTAKDLANRGGLLFPTFSVRDGACTCGNTQCKGPGKHPAFAGWQGLATLDEGRISRWISQGHNLALFAGASGLVVLDVDFDEAAGKDGFASLKELQEIYGDLPETYTVRSPRGGVHLYYSTSVEGGLPPSASKLHKDVDVRSKGSYVLIAGSSHVLGVYKTLSTREIKPLPEDWERLIKSGAPGIQRDDALNGELLAALKMSPKTKALVKAVQKGEPVAEKGARRSTLVSICGVLSNYIVRNNLYPHPGKVVKDLLEPSIKAMSTSEDPGPSVDDIAKALAEFIELDRKDWRNKLLWTQQGLVQDNDANAMIIATYHEELAGQLGYNTRKERACWLASNPWSEEPGEVKESDGHKLAKYLLEKERFSLSAKRILDAINAVSRDNGFDPVHSYFEGLEWDGIPRIGDLLSLYFGAEDTEIHRTISRCFLISAVARTYSPGCKVDTVLVLVGKQGAVKSSGLEALAPPIEGAYTQGSVGGEKDNILILHGPLFFEWDELAGIFRREMETVKAVVSRGTDFIRRPYGRMTEGLDRSGIIVATTNEDEFLIDTTGNRRYWPVKVGDVRIEDIQEERDQLWAEAVAAYKSGEHWWLTPEQEEACQGAREGARVSDPWEDALSTILDRVPADDKPYDASGFGDRDFVTSEELLQALGVQSGQQHAGHWRRLTRSMKVLGWEKESKSRPRGFRRPTR